MNIMSKIESTSFGHIIDGVKVEVRSQHEVRNPATGEVVGQIPLGTKSDIDAAVAAARRPSDRAAAEAENMRYPVAARDGALAFLGVSPHVSLRSVLGGAI
jgi:hypothetical protein